MSTKEKQLTSIIESTDYAKFKIAASNRPLVKSHVELLKTKMKKKYHLDPIMVSTKMEILDGQHRFEAAKALGLPVRYYISTGSTVADMADLNNASRKWSNSDRAHHYVEQGKADYVTYQEFAERFPNFSHGVVLMLLSNQTKRSASIENDFFNGSFKVKNLKKATQIAEMLQDIKPFYKGYNRRSFILAMLTLLENKEFEIKRLMRKLPKKASLLLDFSNEVDYIKALEQIYNWSESKKVRLY